MALHAARISAILMLLLALGIPTVAIAQDKPDGLTVSGAVRLRYEAVVRGIVGHALLVTAAREHFYRSPPGSLRFRIRLARRRQTAALWQARSSVLILAGGGFAPFSADRDAKCRPPIRDPQTAGVGEAKAGRERLQRDHSRHRPQGCKKARCGDSDGKCGCWRITFRFQA
jgi:hypothetical protein